MQYFHVLTVKYHGPTNSNGSRITIRSDRFKQTVTIFFDYSLTSCEEMAINYLKLKGFHIVGIGDGYVITDTFEALK